MADAQFDKPMRPQDIALVLENWAVVAEFFRSRNWPDTNLGHAAMFLHTELPKAMAELAAARSAIEPPSYTAGRQRQADAEALYRMANMDKEELDALGIESRAQAIEYAADQILKNTLVVSPLTETVARKESIPEAWKINPIGYAVRMKNGPFVGIWQDRATADMVRDKQPASHGDEVIPVWSSPRAEADADQAKDAARWIPVKERLPDTDKRSTPAVPVLFVLAEEENNVCAGRFHGRGRRLPWRSLQGAAYRLLEVTHWMPLPDGPHGGGKDG